MEESEPIAESIDEALARVIEPAVLEEYRKFKRLHQHLCKDVKRCHRGQARQALLRYHEKVFSEKVKALVEKTIRGEE